ncbi:MAG TPA: serine/threonine-protein kinase [Polyangiaceae bacterium]
MRADPSSVTIPQAPTARRQPQVIGRYAIYDEIASGGMASVHFGRFAGASGFARTVAIKRAHPHLAREHEFALMFLDEARLAARIRHPNVVATIDVLETPTDLALVMEYVHGESLWRLLRTARDRDERVPVPIAAAILIDTLHGLHAAHEATDERGQPLGLVHRDVSPQNVLVGVDGISRLVDFGIAKAAGRLAQTKDSTVKGKYAYMAPEQARGEPVTRLADTYAAAILFWEMLTGERLFAGKTEAETIHKCLVARVRPPSQLAPHVDPALDAILLTALSRDVASRYPTAREMALAIEEVVPAVRPSEVGAWVEGLAGEALATRAGIQAEIEGSAPSLGAIRVTMPEELAPDEREASAAVLSTRTPERTGTGKRGAVLLAVGAAILGIAAAAAVVAGRTLPRGEPVPSTLAVAPPSAPAPPADSPTAPSSPSPAPSATSATTVIAALGVSAAGSSSSPAAARPPPRTSPPPRGRSRARGSCNPPYSIDSEGREIFKPECM